MPGAVRKGPAGGGPALLVLLAVPMGAAGGLGALIVLAHLLPQLPQHGGGALGTFVGLFVVAAAMALALAYRRWLSGLTGWRGTLWLGLWLVVLLLEGLLLK